MQIPSRLGTGSHDIVPPNFFLVGAPKCGTTAFLRYLEQHPAVLVMVSPIKEPCFFAPEIQAMPGIRQGLDRDRESLRRYLDQPVLERRTTGLVFEWDQYLKLFKGVRDETAVGEGSVSYLCAPGAAAAIRSRVPHARILMILRDPAERLRSQWAALRVARATHSSFLDWMRAQAEREAAGAPMFGLVGTGFYASNVQRYFDTFPAEQIKTILYDDYVRDPQAVLRDVFRFLEVAPDWVCNLTRRHHVNLAPRWPLWHGLTGPLRTAIRHVLPGALSTGIRDRWYRPFRPAISEVELAAAVALYADDIQALAKLIQRDLSAWLDGSQRVCADAPRARDDWCRSGGGWLRPAQLAA